MIIIDLPSELRLDRWRWMAVDGLKRPLCGHRVGMVWARLIRVRGRGTPLMRYHWSCRGERPGFARLRLRRVFSGGDCRDALSPGASGGVAPGQGVRDPQHRGAGRATLTVAEEAAYARAAEGRNHTWAHGSGIDRYLCCIRPRLGGSPGPLWYGILDRRFVREAPSAQDADGAPRARCGGQPTVRRDQLTVQPLGQGHVAGVVGADVGAQLEGAPHQSQRWDTLEPQLLQMPDGSLETLLGQRARQPAPAQHRHGIDVDQIRRGDLISGAQLTAGGRPSCLIVGEGVGQDGGVDNDHRALT